MSKETHQIPGDENSDNSKMKDVLRRQFLQGSAAALSSIIASKAGLFSGSAEARSLEDIISGSEADEASFYYRDRLPDFQTPFENPGADAVSLFDWDFPALVKSATGDGSFGTEGMPSNFSTYTSIPSDYDGTPIAIIGAGAAGLAAGYELMKLGLKPHFFEMQTQDNADGVTYARPNGRIFSWDYGGNGPLEGAGAGWYPNAALSNDTLLPAFGENVHMWGRRVAELGGMRFPATHLTLRTYTDDVFFNDYYYGTNLTTPWVKFRDPGLYASRGASMPNRGGVTPPTGNDTLEFDTVYDTKGIFADRSSANPPVAGGYSGVDRVTNGTSLAASNAAVNNLTFAYFDFLYGDIDLSNPYKGILTPILNLYSDYTNDPSEARASAIANEWKRLIDLYDTMSLGEVLTAAGWDDLPAYPGTWGTMNISLSEMFGEIGTGTGPFAMFYYSSFMELLRIALQAADSQQDYFLGGAGYQLQPFLTNMTQTKNDGITCLWNETEALVVTDKVVAIDQKNNGGVKITTEDGTTRNYTAAIVTAGPAAMRATDIFPVPDEFIPSRVVSYIKRVRINNNSKIAINFPNYLSEPLSLAFWMNRTGGNDTNPNNDDIVTTLTDKTIRQIYTFDNYHWGTEYADLNVGSFANQGTLMLNYGWDYNAQSWTASDTEAAVRSAWKQMTDIYGFGTMYDSYLDWALTNNQVSVIVWEKEDGFNAAWRMAQPGRGTEYGNPSGQEWERSSELQMAQTFGMTSFNPETTEYTGLFLAGEATASPGLSGWVEGSIQTALQAVAGIVKFLNVATPRARKGAGKMAPTGVSFALQAHPGTNPLSQIIGPIEPPPL